MSEWEDSRCGATRLPQLHPVGGRAGAVGRLVHLHLPALHPGLHSGGEAACGDQDLGGGSAGGKP